MTGRGECGFSLAEVVVALGLLGGVLISMAGLLLLGNRMVTSGRSSSEALAIARDAVEEMKSWNFHQTTARFADACDLSQVACTVDASAGTSAAAAAWQGLVDDALGNGRIEILLESLEGAALSAAPGLRVTVTVYWNEGTRARNVRLAMARM